MMPVNLLPDNSENIQEKVNNWRKDPHSIIKYKFMRHFLPRYDKKKRAKLLSHGAIMGYCFSLVLMLGILRLAPRIVPGILGYASDINTTELLKYTNKKRTESSLSTLIINDSLSLAARKKAEHMFENNYWAHVSPSGREPWYFILSENYDYTYAGENLAKNFSTSREVVEAWYDSSSHRDNLLSGNYDEIGFAVVDGVLDGYETTLVVQMFGRPRDRALVASKQDEALLTPAVEVTEEAAMAELPSSETIVVSPSPGTEVLPFVDVATASRGVSIAFAGFMVVLFALDVWYSKRKGIVKFTGHTLAHLSILVFVLASIVFLFRPGVIL